MASELKKVGNYYIDFSRANTALSGSWLSLSGAAEGILVDGDGNVFLSGALGSGAIAPQYSGSYDLGTSGLRFGTTYTNELVVNPGTVYFGDKEGSAKISTSSDGKIQLTPEGEDAGLNEVDGSFKIINPAAS